MHNTNEQFLYIKRTLPNGYLDFVNVGITYPNPNFIINRHSLCEFYTIEYVLSGRGVMTYKGQEYEISPGSFYCIHRNIDISYRSSETEPFTKLWFNVKGEILDKICDIFGIGDFILVQADVEKNFREMQKLIKLINSSNEHEIMLKLAKCIFALFCDVKGAEIFKTKKISTAEKIKNYLENHSDYNLSLDHLAKNFHMSKVHVSRLFKERYGCTPLQYHKIKRFELAKHLLLENNNSLKTIASMLNFDNVYYFMTQFKKEFGITPTEWRKTAIKNVEEERAPQK